jgi:hypothetical protein
MNKEYVFVGTAQLKTRDYINQLEKENKELKDNWNKLREYIGAEWYCYDNESVECEVAGDILDKMQELQGSRE